MDETFTGEQHVTTGTRVIDASGDWIGIIAAVNDRWFEVTPDPSAAVLYRVPLNAVASGGDESVTLLLSRDSLAVLAKQERNRMPVRDEAPLGAGGGTSQGAGEGNAFTDG